MKRMFFILALLLSAVKINAQDSVSKDTTISIGNITVFLDSRIELLAKKEAELNEAIANGPKFAKGFRLMVLSTNDRTQAMNLRAKLLQLFPEQKIYMSFQPPHIKVKLGNFLEKTEADQYKKEIILNKLVTTDIYLLPEIIEIKTEKNKE
jgi:SPOR domain